MHNIVTANFFQILFKFSNVYLELSADFLLSQNYSQFNAYFSHILNVFHSIPFII